MTLDLGQIQHIIKQTVRGISQLYNRKTVGSATLGVTAYFLSYCVIELRLFKSLDEIYFIRSYTSEDKAEMYEFSIKDHSISNKIRYLRFLPLDEYDQANILEEIKSRNLHIEDFVIYQDARL